MSLHLHVLLEPRSRLTRKTVTLQLGSVDRPVPTALEAGLDLRRDAGDVRR